MLDSSATTGDGADPPANAQAYSVSDLAVALKRTLEDAFGFVRLRGEVSKVTRHASGHIYLSLKDDRATIDGVVWKGSVRALGCQPQTGLEVIVTGRITTYPARSSYQLVIETMSPAGIGALLAQLEQLKAKLQGEGLFEGQRKRPLPAMPSVIGVITSPTGAVIRDILHRVRDRWPAHILVWPVVVQGADAARQVAQAIRGFNALGPTSDVIRPDVLIVARGGGSIEDLWPFNDEALARAAGAGTIPLISAVGHETDTTLLDFVADRRAPTPTAAAEMATPVLADLAASILGLEQRLGRSVYLALESRRQQISAAGRGLPKPQDILGVAAQRFDMAASRLGVALHRNVAVHDKDLMRVGARLSAHLLDRTRRSGEARVSELGARLQAACLRGLGLLEERAARVDQLRRSFNPDGPLERGFARVVNGSGALARRAGDLQSGEAVGLIFSDGRRDAIIDDGPPPIKSSKSRARPSPSPQGDLF